MYNFLGYNFSYQTALAKTHDDPTQPKKRVEKGVSLKTRPSYSTHIVRLEETFKPRRGVWAAFGRYEELLFVSRSPRFISRLPHCVRFHLEALISVRSSTQHAPSFSPLIHCQIESVESNPV